MVVNPWYFACLQVISVFFLKDILHRLGSFRKDLEASPFFSNSMKGKTRLRSVPVKFILVRQNAYKIRMKGVFAYKSSTKNERSKIASCSV